jgi:hypothetical protein
MKILFMNPHVEAMQQIVQAFQARGVGALLALDATEAWQILQLHGQSVDLMVIHRENEAGADEGISLLQRLKAVPQGDLFWGLPIILSSGVWDSARFAEHQKSSDGANAYIRWPYEFDGIEKLVVEIFGGQALSPPGNEALIPLAPSLPQLPELELPIAEEPLAGEPLVDADVPLDLQQFQMSGVSEDLDAPANLPQAQAQEPVLGMPPEQVPEALDIFEIKGEDLPFQGSDENPRAEELQLPGQLPVDVPVDVPQAPSERTSEAELAAELPYLFGEGRKSGDSSRAGKLAESADPGWAFAEPVGDAVIPGGASSAPDLETFKRYLILREQDVAVLSAQLKASQERVVSVELALKTEKAKCGELELIVQEQKNKIDGFEKEKALALENFQSEMDELRFQSKVKSDKAKLLEQQIRDAALEIERLKERVRSDIRKIRVREKELENRLEITKKDSEALITGRENKIIELKRKVDLLEFNMDLLQDQYSREKDHSNKLRERLAKAAQVLRVASGLLDSPGEELAPGSETKAS